MPVTFGSWFSRFSELYEIQECGIPAVVAGGDVLLCSPTASGKTETYAAPAAELVLRTGCQSATVLIVSPTRALANDLKRRLEGLMGLIQVPFGRYTGEHKEKVGGRIPSISVVTPEALDSLLARRPQALRGVRMVILDEIHVLDGTARGDHLLVLLHRLERAAQERPQRVAASATVERPAELAARYLRNASTITVPQPRRILGRSFDGRDPKSMAAHLEFLADHGFKKILVFCRSRNQLENLTAKLSGRTGFGDAVFAHHGSLARSLRERNERLFLQAPKGVCFATLTLEMGIDIGTVDYVLLAHVPASVSSLLQRIGRGSRRTGVSRCGYVVEDAGELFLFETFLRLAQEGRLCEPPWGFRPSIVVQQALVMACANAYLELADLEHAIPPSLRAELGPDACKRILEQAVEVGWLERSGRDRFVPSEDVESRYERGTLHSNISDTSSVEVVDRVTGDVVGHVAGVEQREIELGGRERRIVHAGERRILTDAGSEASPACFRSAAPPLVSFALARACVGELGVAPGSIAWVSENGPAVLLHGLGTIGAVFLLQLLRVSTGATPFTMSMPVPPERLPCPSEEQIDAFIGANCVWLARALAPGPFVRGVPRELEAASLRRRSGIDEVAEFLRSAQLQSLRVTLEGGGAILARL